LRANVVKLLVQLYFILRVYKNYFIKLSCPQSFFKLLGKKINRPVNAWCYRVIKYPIEKAARKAPVLMAIDCAPGIRLHRLSFFTSSTGGNFTCKRISKCVSILLA